MCLTSIVQTKKKYGYLYEVKLFFFIMTIIDDSEGSEKNLSILSIGMYFMDLLF